MGEHISLNPDDQTSGGGFLDNTIATVTDLRFVDDFDYGGTLPEPLLGLRAVYEVEQDGQTATFDRTYSGGKLDRMIPTDDGFGLQPNPNWEGKPAKGLSRNSNAARWFRAITGTLEDSEFEYPQDAEPFPKEQVTGRTDVFIGAKVLLASISFEGAKPAPYPISVVELPRTGTASTSTRVATTGRAVPPKGQPSAAHGAAADGNDVRAKAIKAIVAVVTGNAGKIQKAKLPQAVYQHLTPGGKADKDRNAVFQLSFQDAFLKTVEEIEYDGKVIRLAQGGEDD